MFYSSQVLSKRGPLGIIWIAAHLESKLKKHQIRDANILVSVDSILNPDVPLTLRLSGHLLLGVVNIYKRKVIYLVQDCNEAFAKIRTAFRAADVDLPANATTAPFASITLPEHHDDLEFHALPAASRPSQGRLSLGGGLRGEEEQLFVSLGGVRGAGSGGSLRLPDAPLEFLSQHTAEDQFAAGGDDAYLDEEMLMFAPAETERLRSVLPGSAERARDAARAGPAPGTTLADDLSLLPPGAGDEEMFAAPADYEDGAGDYGGDRGLLPDVGEDDAAGRLPGAAGRLSLDSAGGRGRGVAGAEDPFLPSGTPGALSLLGSTPGGHLPGGSQPATQLAAAAAAAVQRQPPAAKRRRVAAARVDDATQLSSDVMRRGLEDTSDITRPRLEAIAARCRARAAAAAGAGTWAAAEPAAWGLAAGSASALEAALARPRLPGALAPELLDMFARALRPPPEAAGTSGAQQAAAGPSPGRRGTPAGAAEAGPAGAPDFDGPADMDDAWGLPGDDGGGGGASSPPGEGEEEPRRATPAGKLPSSSRKGKEPLGSTPGGSSGGGGGGAGEEGEEGGASTSWSKRTKATLGFLQEAFEEAGGRKGVAGAGPLPMGPMLEGKGRTEAARLFFECLVLRARGYVQLKQPEPYGDIDLAPGPKMLQV